MRYKCLVLDHDDTAVRSTREIHFPAFQLALERLRPGVKISLEEYFMYCFDPGFGPMCSDIFGFTREEIDREQDEWARYVGGHMPAFYEGFPALVRRQKAQGGLICVVTHSQEEMVRRDYLAHCGFEPELVFGWERGEGRRKPDPYPLREIMRIYGLAPEELLMVDDLRPGYEMAKRCGVPFACAGWSHETPAIERFMRSHCDYYLETVEELERFLFGASAQA